MSPRAGVALVALGLMPRAGVDPGLTSVHAAAIRDSVTTALSAYQAQAAAGQWDSVLTFYADDPGFRWVEEGRVVADSVDDIRRTFSGLPAGLRIETEFTGLEITPLAPGAASVVTAFSTRFRDSTGVKFAFGGMMTVAMVHHGARWQFLTGHSSTTRSQAP